jgi:hypothetical protein
MYDVKGLAEELVGILTLNYDGYLEAAVQIALTYDLSPGVDLGSPVGRKTPLRVLKLHGSFDWTKTWPITAGEHHPLWIPPGIQKAKGHYPFNLLWGLAREVLDCDILRIVGCRLGSNDWDLISLLFNTRHTNSRRKPYRVEVIDSPKEAKRLQMEFPYLGVQSILEVEPIGSQLIAEFTGSSPRVYDSLTASEQQSVIDMAGTDKNWFRLWLKQMAEALHRDLGSVATGRGVFKSLLEAY